MENVGNDSDDWDFYSLQLHYNIVALFVKKRPQSFYGYERLAISQKPYVQNNVMRCAQRTNSENKSDCAYLNVDKHIAAVALCARVNFWQIFRLSAWMDFDNPINEAFS